jgi:hypothetical protein
MLKENTIKNTKNKIEFTDNNIVRLTSQSLEKRLKEEKSYLETLILSIKKDKNSDMLKEIEDEVISNLKLTADYNQDIKDLERLNLIEKLYKNITKKIKSNKLERHKDLIIGEIVELIYKKEYNVIYDSIREDIRKIVKSKVLDLEDEKTIKLLVTNEKTLFKR